jgi:hypothetical protein
MTPAPADIELPTITALPRRSSSAIVSRPVAMLVDPFEHTFECVVN